MIAADAFSWLAAAKASWRSREIPTLALNRSVESPMAMRSYASVSPSSIMESANSALPRRNPARAPIRRWGACVMDSIPPATTISASPDLIIWSAR